MEPLLLARHDDEQENRRGHKEDEVAMANLQIGSGPFGDMGTDTSRTRIKATAHIPDEAERRHQNEVGRKIPKEAFRVHCWRREEDDDERVAYVALCILHTDRRPNKNFK